MKMKTHNKSFGAGAVLWGRFIVLHGSIEKPETSNSMIQIKKLEKQEQAKSKLNWWQEITKGRAEIREIETKRIIQKSTNLRAGPLRR